MTPTTTWYLVLAAVLFGVGVVGLMIRRNPLVMFMCIELMLKRGEPFIRGLRPGVHRYLRSDRRVLRDGGGSR